MRKQIRKVAQWTAGFAAAFFDEFGALKVRDRVYGAFGRDTGKVLDGFDFGIDLFGFRLIGRCRWGS